MARKIRFDVSDSAEVVEPAAPSPAPLPAPSRAPSLSGMARSLQAAAAASIREIDPRLIDDSAFQDRIDPDQEEILELAESIRAQGQLIPILVSPLPAGRFRIVYGRRRLAALRQLGVPAKALVRDLDEDQAILAQGQENTFRKDLSWIEKAAFAKQLLEAGKSDELVCDALNIDQKARRTGEKLTGLSRMRQVTARLSSDLIAAIGAAPKVGRDRWYEISQALEKKGFPPGNQAPLTAEILAAAEQGLPSDDRFTLLETILRRPAPDAKPAASAKPMRMDSALGSVAVNPRQAVITISRKASADLHRWIAENPDDALTALHDARQKHEQP